VLLERSVVKTSETRHVARLSPPWRAEMAIHPPRGTSKPRLRLKSPEEILSPGQGVRRIGSQIRLNRSKIRGFFDIFSPIRGFGENDKPADPWVLVVWSPDTWPIEWVKEASLRITPPSLRCARWWVASLHL
jgi:hypothetical protein